MEARTEFWGISEKFTSKGKHLYSICAFIYPVHGSHTSKRNFISPTVYDILSRENSQRFKGSMILIKNVGIARISKSRS